MVDGNRKDESETLNLPVVKRPRRKVWFLNGDLVRVEHTSRAAGIVTLYNLTQDRRETTTVIDFKKKRKRDFTVKETAQLIT